VNRRKLIKTKHIKECNKEIILGKQWRNIELPEVRKKEYTNKRRKYLLNVLQSEEDNMLRRWAEHFDELLNTEFSNQNITSKEIYQAYLDTDEPTPTLDEVDNAVQKLKNNKAPGIDLIQAELIKKASPDFVECMYQLITKIWITETIPEDWNWSIICPIHKKGDVTIS
jgi:hypothetical protein